MIGYKLFEQDTEGNLYPLFIGKKESFPIGRWIEAKILPTKGFAVRPGFHIGEIPDAYWLKSKDGTYKSQRSKYWKRVWAECEYCDAICYDDVVSRLPKKCFQDRLPINGYYKFRESGLNRVWVITDKIKINRILTDAEIKEILGGLK